MKKILLLIFIIIPSISHAKHRYHESYYQKNWCAGRGQAEVVLPDRTRCDCITPTHAVEVDFAPKFYEAIVQALYYSLQTGRKGSVLLILEKPSDYKYWLRLNSVIDHFKLPIDTWRVGL